MTPKGRTLFGQDHARDWDEGSGGAAGIRFGTTALLRNGTSGGTAYTALRTRHCEHGIADSGDAARFAVEPLGAFFGMARKASERT
jgi:hypothetical protein